MMDMRSDSRAKDELVNYLVQEMKFVRDKLSELKLQIDQTQLVVDREQQRNANVAAELRTVQDNIETVPRPDIRAKYDEAMEARFRLTTMRGQLEKFQSTREGLERTQGVLNNLLNKLQGVETIPAATNEPGVSGGMSNTPSIMRLIQGQEEERKRLARQMHDGPAQSLTNFILQTEICQRLFDRNPARAAEELDTLKAVANVTFQKVRDFIFDLRPMMLDDLGIVPTVRRYIDSFREKNDIEVLVDILGEERRLETHREVLIFRGIQELMGYARDYANAAQINITLDITSIPLQFEVEDNGRGFDAETLLNADRESIQDPRAQGMIALKERFALIGGAVEIFSTETEGTTVKVTLPDSD